MTQSVIQPKRPRGQAWQSLPLPADTPATDYPLERWYHPDSGVQVLSAVEVARGPGEPDLGPEYHLSMSGPNATRVPRHLAKWVLREFGLEDATEDNHVPHGFVRNWWRPVADRLSGYECACKDEEPAVVEDKGDFVWRGVTR